MKHLYICIAVLSSLILSCGSNIFESAPQIQKKEVAAGSAGTQLAFSSVVAQVDDLKEGDGGDALAAIMLRSQIDLLQINGGDSALGETEKGRCLMVWPGGDFSSANISSELTLSPKSRVVYSESADLRSEDCQVFFMENMGDLMSEEFFNLHISFFSFTF